jgi:hypothetical protein
MGIAQSKWTQACIATIVVVMYKKASIVMHYFLFMH